MNNDLLQKRILELNEQLMTEREEYREMYRRLKNENEDLLTECNEYKELYIKTKKQYDELLNYDECCNFSNNIGSI